MSATNLLAAIAQSADRDWLQTCRRHNAERGRREVVEAADRRLRDLDLRDALRTRPETRGIEERVLESVRVYEALLQHEHGRRQPAGYTRRAIREHGPVGALIRTIRSGTRQTQGHKLLREYDRLDATYEQIAIDYADELTAMGCADVVEKARQLLAGED
jgi:hypothetical protein